MSCECCVLSGRGLCDGLITRPKEYYRLWCIVACDLETSRGRRPWPLLGRNATKRNLILRRNERDIVNVPGCRQVLSPTRKETSSEACHERARFQQHRTRAAIKFFFFFLQGKAPKEIHAILRETLACFLPGRAKDLSAPLYIGLHVRCYYSCQLLMKLEFTRQSFEKYSNIKFHENPSSGSRAVDGWTDGQARRSQYLLFAIFRTCRKNHKNSVWGKLRIFEC